MSIETFFFIVLSFVCSFDFVPTLLPLIHAIIIKYQMKKVRRVVVMCRISKGRDGLKINPDEQRKVRGSLKIIETPNVCGDSFSGSRVFGRSMKEALATHVVSL